MDIGYFFSPDYHGEPFQIFGAAHLAALLVIVLFNVALLRFKGASESARARLRWGLAIVIWLNEIAWHIWNVVTGQWTIQTMLPLHLCSWLVWVGSYGCAVKNYSIYEFSYFMGIGGALQALLTPDIGIYGFPHFRFIQTYISHGILVTAPIYLTLVEGFRPTWKSIWRVFLWTNALTIVAFFTNLAIGSNYMFVAHKPSTASILDMFPDWPIYILFIELLGLMVSLLLYLPFIIKDGRQQKL